MLAIFHFHAKTNQFIPNHFDIQDNLAIAPEPFPLVDLNNDCIIAVFSKLSSVDLVNVSEVCQRFSRCARDAILQQNSSLNLTNAYAKEEVRSVIATFGRITRKMVIDMKFFPGWFGVFSPLQTISENCGRLSSITLVNANFNFITGASHLPMIKHLTIENSTMYSGLYYINAWFRHLESVTLINVRLSMKVMSYIRNNFQPKYLKSKETEYINFHGVRLVDVVVEKAIFHAN